VRLSVAVEDYDHQHQDLRVENGTRYGDTVEEMDFPYLRRVTALNVAALAALARAPAPPEPRVQGAVSTDTLLEWRGVPGAVDYVMRWRRTDAAQWQHSRRVSQSNGRVCVDRCPPIEGDQQLATFLRGIRVDDWVFGVSSVSADGYESPVVSAVPGGAFRPWTPPPQAAQ
jgi:hypothetical protein